MEWIRWVFFGMMCVGLGAQLRDLQWRRITGRTFREAREQHDREKHLARWGDD